MDDYMVERIPGGVRIDPQGGQGERRRKKGKTPRRDGHDSVEISEEARRRSMESEAEDKEPETAGG